MQFFLRKILVNSTAWSNIDIVYTFEKVIVISSSCNHFILILLFNEEYSNIYSFKILVLSILIFHTLGLSIHMCLKGVALMIWGPILSLFFSTYQTLNAIINYCGIGSSVKNLISFQGNFKIKAKTKFQDVLAVRMTKTKKLEICSIFCFEKYLHFCQFYKDRKFYTRCNEYN